jgi:hypothetical protein
MTPDELRDLILAQPWRPLRIVTRDGRRYTIRHRRHIGMGVETFGLVLRGDRHVTRPIADILEAGPLPEAEARAPRPHAAMAERLADAHRAAPFRPFTLHMADGPTHRVDHPRSLAYRPGTRTAVVVGPRGEASLLDTMLISEIEVEAGPID